MDALQVISFSLRDFAYVFFKRKSQILLFFLAIVATVAIWTFLATPIYEAESEILVKTGRENVYMPTSSSGTTPNAVISLNREEQINSEIEILMSQSLLEMTAESLGPAIIYKELVRKSSWLEPILVKFSSGSQEGRLSPVQQAAKRLQKDLSIGAVKKSNIIEVKMKNRDPQMAAMVLNKLVELYMDQHLEVYKTPQSYKFFQEQSQILHSKLKDSDDQLEAFKRKHNVTSLDEERRLLLSEEGALRAELNRTLSQIVEAENRMVQIERQVAATPKTVPTGEETEHNPSAFDNLQATIMQLELKEKELLSKYTDQSRLVQNVKEEIRIVRMRLAEQDAKKYGKSVSGLNTTYQRLQEELYRNQADVKALKAKREAQASQLAEYRGRLDKLNGIEVELKGLQRQVDVHQQNYRLYLTKFEESRISDAMDSEKITNVKQIQPARAPLDPVSPKVFLNLLIGLFLAAFVSLGLAFIMERLNDRLEKPEDAESLLKLPVLATIPELRS